MRASGQNLASCESHADREANELHLLNVQLNTTDAQGDCGNYIMASSLGEASSVSEYPLYHKSLHLYKTHRECPDCVYYERPQDTQR